MTLHHLILLLFACLHLFGLFLFFLFIEFSGVILVNKIIQGSGVQFHIICTVHCVFTTPIKSPTITIIPPTPPPSPSIPFPSPGNHHTAVHEFFYLLSCLFFAQYFHSPPSPNPIPSQLSDCSLSVSLPVFCFLVHLVL